MRENNIRSHDQFTTARPQAVERRGFDRLRCLLLVDYAVADIAYRDFVRDISCGGMFIETRRRFSKGLRIHIVLSALGIGSIKARGRIASSSREGIGVIFDAPWSDAQLKSLLLSWV